jgi:transcription-repair coupling factor (superfamily II helicase)
VQKLCPDIDLAMAHGQMDPKALERTLVDFIEKKHDVLLCTNIIETGLDIPNVNTIIVNNAHQFGMSDLHQLRGRVGRSNKKAYCYLFSPPLSTITRDARKRLQTLEEFSDLGSGFNIAMKDLDIRGAGNLLGAEQSGFIADIGYETYQKILEEAIQELKENEFKELFKEELEKQSAFVREVTVDCDVEMLIPDAYVTNIQERLNLYTSLDDIEDEHGITEFEGQLIDRFGPIPEPVFALFDALRLRWLCRKLGFERLVYKNNVLRCFFLANTKSLYYESDQFKKILAFISTDTTNQNLRLKQTSTHLIMIAEKIPTIEGVRLLLEKLEHASRTQFATA